jgi:aminoglycoside phosphotransferase (APT) family kinase protein
VYRALEPLGIPIPHVWAVDEDLDGFLVDRARGQVWFRPPADPAIATLVAQDFMRHLATWHAAGARALDLPSFGPVRSIAHHQRDQLAGIEAVFAREDDAQPIDQLARIQLDHLVHHVPDHDGDPVLVQGDTGPGNFMYEGERVTAIVDWELAHLGDPMDDIAWLSWRATQQGWPDFPTRLREYEQASGIGVDAARVRYYRLNACARLGPRFGLADMGEGTTRPLGPVGATDAAVDRYADGSGLVMNMLHRRMRLAAQADAMGIELPGREVHDEAASPSHAVLYDAVLGQLRAIVDRTDDRAVSNLAKAAARQVKYLGELDRNRRRFEEHELDDLGRLLGRTPPSLAEGRSLLAAAARDGTVEFDDYLLYHWARLIRDDWMMRKASGAMYERHWPELIA